MPLPLAGGDDSLTLMERGRMIRDDGRRASRQAPAHRMRMAAMLRRQLVADVVTAMFFVLGLAVGTPISMLLVLLMAAVPVTAAFVVREG